MSLNYSAMKWPFYASRENWIGINFEKTREETKEEKNLEFMVIDTLALYVQVRSFERS